MLKLTMTCTISILSASVTHADDVYLKTGFVLRNVQVVDTANGMVNIRRDGQTIRVALEDVLKLDYGELSGNQKSTYEMFSPELYEEYKRKLPERQKRAREAQEQMRLVFADPQHRSDSNPSWFSMGIGAGFLERKNRQAISGGLALSHQWGEHLFSIRFVHNTIPHFGFGDDDAILDLAVLYGRSTRADFGFASVGAGIAFVGGESSSVGFPVQAQLLWTPSSSFGIGLHAFANLNRVRTFAGILLAINFGSFTTKGIQ